jgi:hypothetical protein
MNESVPNPGPQAGSQNLPVVVQPDPMFEERGAIVGTVAVWLGAFVVVALVLYGITRQQAPQQQMANVPSQATQIQPASGNAQAQKPEPSTTGQGQGGEQGKMDQSKTEKSEGNAPRSDSSNNAGPKNQPQQQAQ